MRGLAVWPPRQRRRRRWLGQAPMHLRRLLFPGMNLHARLRYRRIAAELSPAAGAPRLVIDAGCGNGMLAYQACRRGNLVRGITIKPEEAAKARRYFNGFLAIDERRLTITVESLHEAELGDAVAEEIICTEVLEHIRDDSFICRRFWAALKPGGVLHLTAPNADHPYNRSFPLDLDETGGHVRAGYTPEDWRALLEPIGFRVEAVEPLGGPVRQCFNRLIKETQARFGPAAGLPLFLLALPALLFESRRRERACPFAWYVKAVKPAEAPLAAARRQAQAAAAERIASAVGG